ncbi:MAG: glycine--tRNA ligase subunit beta [Gemmatimonas sp.]
MAELLLELLSEEIPARMQVRAADDLKRIVSDALKAAGLEFTQASAYVTPRRVALVVDGLPTKQPDVTEEKKGPRVGAPDQAIQGFLKGAGLASLDQCEKRTVGKAEFWFAVVSRKGRITAEVLAEALPDAVARVPWPKSMRWGSESVRWVRPLQSILCVFDGRVVQFAFGPVRSGDSTRGHRFLAPGALQVKSFAEYRQKLRSAYVVIDHGDRANAIWADAGTQAKTLGLTLKDDRGLLEEVAGLVEWPVPLVGTIDESFMDVPAEVLTTAMRTHQKYFALLKDDGSLANNFVTVANMLTDDGGQAVVAGNERVLRARLSDARFFWDQDRKVPLAERVPALREIVFHAKLGTVADKVERIVALAAELAPVVGADRDRVRSAAELCKADLVTGMVGEFPELQGIMGRYYALHGGEAVEVANAIAEHYAPKGPNDACPHAPVSVAVALADKIDTLVGFFGVGEKPTGSGDPFALRRAALGVIRIVLENDLRLPLAKAFRSSERTYEESAPGRLGESQVGDLLAFFADRLKVALREKGVRHDLIDAVFSLGGEDDLVRLVARVNAIDGFLKTADGVNLLVAYRRAANIVAIEEKKDKVAYGGDVDEARLAAGEEKRLVQALAVARMGIDAALVKEDFVGAMEVLAALRPAVDIFFDKVTVNADDRDLRANRLRLLAAIRDIMNRIADFATVEG